MKIIFNTLAIRLFASWSNKRINKQLFSNRLNYLTIIFFTCEPYYSECLWPFFSNRNSSNNCNNSVWPNCKESQINIIYTRNCIQKKNKILCIQLSCCFVDEGKKTWTIAMWKRVEKNVSQCTLCPTKSRIRSHTQRCDIRMTASMLKLCTHFFQLNFQSLRIASNNVEKHFQSNCSEMTKYHFQTQMNRRFSISVWRLFVCFFCSKKNLSRALATRLSHAKSRGNKCVRYIIPVFRRLDSTNNVQSCRPAHVMLLCDTIKRFSDNIKVHLILSLMIWECGKVRVCF